MKDIICKEYDEGTELGFQSEILTRVDTDFFLPVSFQILDSEGKIVAFFDVSETDEMRMQYDGSESAYIAVELIRGMMEASDYYIMPEDYILKRELIRVGRRDEIKLLYVPSGEVVSGTTSYSRRIRDKVRKQIMELYPRDGIAYREMYEETLEVLGDPSLGIDTCLRKLELAKEEAFNMKRERAYNRIDFSH